MYRSKVIAAVVAANAAFATTAFASETSADLRAALRNQGENQQSVKNPDAMVPEIGQQQVKLRDVVMRIPATGEVDNQDGLAVFDGRGQANEVAVQTTTDGVRALIHIDSPRAPERYEFVFGGTVASLKMSSDHSVILVDQHGNPAGQIAPAWAQDRNGKAIPTHYEIDGTTLIQVVSHRSGSFTYGITADPSVHSHWWGFTLDLNAGDVGSIASVGLAGFGVWAARTIRPMPVAIVVAAAGAAVVATCQIAHRHHRRVKYHFPKVGPAWPTFPHN